MHETGRLHGLAFVAKIGKAHHAGMQGDYRRNPDEALPAAVRLKEAILRNQREEYLEDLGT